MIEPPRPLSLGEILDRTVNFYRSRFWLFFGISVIPTGVVLVIASGVFFFFAWIGSSGTANTSPAAIGVASVLFLGAVGVFALPILLAASALSAAAINHAANCVWQGESITIRDAYKTIWSRSWRYIWLYLLVALIVGVAPGAVWVAIISFSAGMAALGASAGMGASAGALLGLLIVLVVVALLVYCIWMLLRLCLAFPACVVEQTPAWDAIKRSSALSRGTRGRVFLLYLLGTVLGWVLSGGVTMIVAIVAALMPGMSSPQHAERTGVVILFVSYSAAFAMQALTKPVYGIALMLFYYDQRIRLEGFDIEWMMQKAGLVAPVPAAMETGHAAEPSLPASGLLARRSEVEPVAETATGEPVALAETTPDSAQLTYSGQPSQFIAAEDSHAASEEST
jgi:uncharacterized membrane protein